MELIESVRAGNAVLLATDTVFGVAALPGSEGHRQIFQLKERSCDQVLPWLVGDVGDLDRYGKDIQPCARALVSMFWPGALTIVVKASSLACKLGGVAKDGTVALRMPDNDGCLQVLRRLHGPLACTSANRHGEEAPVRLSEVGETFLALDHDPLIPSSCPLSKASTIVDCTGALPKVLREGGISRHVVEAVALLDGKIS